MNRLADVKVGDTIVLHLSVNQYRHPERNIRRVVVDKVGRTLIHVSSEHDVGTSRFRIEDGCEVAAQICWHAYTEDEWADLERRRELVSRLGKLGCEVKAGSQYIGWRYSADTLEAVAVVLEGAMP